MSRSCNAFFVLIGHYEMLAGVLNNTGLPRDARLKAVLAAAWIPWSFLRRGDIIRSKRLTV